MADTPKLPNGAFPLQAKAQPESCPLCAVWVAYQHERNMRPIVLAQSADVFDTAEAHSFLVAGYWAARNRNGEVCTAHQSQLVQLDRMFGATTSAALKLPGDS